MKQKDDECFGDGMDDGLDEDFDFEGNLALFDKAAVFSQIDTSRSRGTPEKQAPARYRHDENILEAKPIVYRQITVPQPAAKEYCTGAFQMPVCVLVCVSKSTVPVSFRSSDVHLLHM